MSELIKNHAKRVHTLKERMQQLQDGGAPEDVKRALRILVRKTCSSEITAAEKAIMTKGIKPSEAGWFENEVAEEIHAQ